MQYAPNAPFDIVTDYLEKGLVNRAKERLFGFIIFLTMSNLNSSSTMLPDAINRRLLGMDLCPHPNLTDGDICLDDFRIREFEQENQEHRIFDFKTKSKFGSQSSKKVNPEIRKDSVPSMGGLFGSSRTRGRKESVSLDRLALFLD